MLAKEELLLFSVLRQNSGLLCGQCPDNALASAHEVAEDALHRGHATKGDWSIIRMQMINMLSWRYIRRLELRGTIIVTAS